MDAIQKFKEAAVALQQDERCLALSAARRASDNDEELQEMIGEFNLVRLDLNNEIEKDDRDDERITILNDRVNALYNGIMQNKSMLGYNEAKEAIKPVVAYINAIITAAVDGDDPMQVQQPQESCGDGGCAGCSGCG